MVVVEHERELISAADWVIELGPGAGAKGGTVIAQGPPGQLETDPQSIMGPFLAGAAAVSRDRPAHACPGGQITIEISDLYNLHDLSAAFPVQRLTALAGPSGAGKAAVVLDSLIPAARAVLGGPAQPGPARPGHVRHLDLGGIRQIIQVDATPIGQNARSTHSQRGALYVFDEPSTGLHPLDVATLVSVFDRLLAAGATIIVIDHDLDLLAAADHLIDMGPGGGPDGGHILAAGTPEDVARDPGSVTGPWLARHLNLPEASPAQRPASSEQMQRAGSTMPA